MLELFRYRIIQEKYLSVLTGDRHLYRERPTACDIPRQTGYPHPGLCGTAAVPHQRNKRSLPDGGQSGSGQGQWTEQGPPQ